MPPAARHAHHPPSVGASGERHRDGRVRVALVSRAEPPEGPSAPSKKPAVAGQDGGVGPSGGGLDDGDAIEGADFLGGEAGGARAVPEAEPVVNFFLVFF